MTRRVTVRDPWEEHQRTLVPCPTCGATGSHCKRPSGHAADGWHTAREDAHAQACGCDGCQAWLTSRTQP